MHMSCKQKSCKKDLSIRAEVFFSLLAALAKGTKVERVLKLERKESGITKLPIADWLVEQAHESVQLVSADIGSAVSEQATAYLHVCLAVFDTCSQLLHNEESSEFWL